MDPAGFGLCVQDDDICLALEAEEEIELAEREFAAELLRKVGGKGNVKVNPYHYKLKWVSKRGFVNLKAVAGYINLKYVIKLELRRKQIEKFPKTESQKDEDLFAVHPQEQKLSKPDSTELPKAEMLLKSGGECLDPKMFVVSYPGKSRMELFEILGEMKLEFDEAGGDIHVMNEGKSEQDNEPKPLPEDWVEEFGDLPTWDAMVIHLQGIREIDGSYPFKDGLTAPKWFVEHWGRAAWNAARNSKMNGSGVLIFHSWMGYTWSLWCQLEFLFCKCLAQRFPRSVYVIRNSMFAYNQKMINKGYFMKGMESYY